MARDLLEPYDDRPTRVRYRVLGFAAALSMITYLDRVCMASAADPMARDLGLGGASELRGPLSAFALAYALFEVPTGWLGDVFGPRKVLIRIVLWWSFFTAVTGLIGYTVGGVVLGSFSLFGWFIPAIWTLIAIRFLFGMGEAGAYPNITRALHNWFPAHERGFAQGTVWMSARLMGGLTPLVWAVLVEGITYTRTTSGGAETVSLWDPLMQWRATFWLFAVLGVVWCVLFAMRFRNRPEESAAVNPAELALIKGGGAGVQAGHSGVPWLRIISSRNLWYLCIMYACQSYGWYFYIAYLPSFLNEQYGRSTSFWYALAKGGPLWMGAIGCFLGGLLTDWYIRRTGNRRVGRRIFGAIGHGACVFCFLSCLVAPNVYAFFLVISLAGFFADLTMASSWAICQDIGRRHSAIVAGFMNMVGNLGGALGTWVSGYLVSLAKESYSADLGVAVNTLSELQTRAAALPGHQINFVVFAAVHVIGVICWLKIDATKPVSPEEG